MKRRLLAAAAVFTLLLGALPATTLASGGQNVLRPGQTVTFKQRVPINIVFVGYQRSAINKHDLLGQLPDTYSPVVRYPQLYGLPGRDMGLQYNFDYHVTILNVLWALGWSMIALSALVHLPVAVVTMIGVVMIAGHNLLDAIKWTHPIWMILHR